MKTMKKVSYLIAGICFLGVLIWALLLDSEKVQIFFELLTGYGCLYAFVYFGLFIYKILQSKEKKSLAKAGVAIHAGYGFTYFLYLCFDLGKYYPHLMAIAFSSWTIALVYFYYVVIKSYCEEQ